MVASLYVAGHSHSIPTFLFLSPSLSLCFFPDTHWTLTPHLQWTLVHISTHIELNIVALFTVLLGLSDCLISSMYFDISDFSVNSTAPLVPAFPSLFLPYAVVRRTRI